MANMLEQFGVAQGLTARITELEALVAERDATISYLTDQIAVRDDKIRAMAVALQPAKGTTETSEAAADSVAPTVSLRRVAVLGAIAAQGPVGPTALHAGHFGVEGTVTGGFDLQEWRRRISECQKYGWVEVDTVGGATTVHGRGENTYRITAAGWAILTPT